MFLVEDLDKLPDSFTLDAKVLLAGPWVGEFGWELFGWQGYLRHLSHEFPKVIVISRPGMEYLYEDFCYRFIPCNPSGPGTGGWKCGAEKDPPRADLFVPREGDLHKKCVRLDGQFCIGYSLRHPNESSSRFFDQEFVKLGLEKEDDSYDVIVHIRKTSKNHSRQRNGWSEKDWEEFAKPFSDLSIACIGTTSEAGMIPQAKDLRGLDLKTLCGVIRGAKCVVGPSSGPMHLAALCETPQVVWSINSCNTLRYMRFWNPFRAEVSYKNLHSWRSPVKHWAQRQLEYYLCKSSTT
jgi:hypothetical protein